MALGRPPFKKKVTCRNKENDKQYETKCVWIFLQSWLVGNKWFNYSSPPKNFFLGEKRRYKEKWMSRFLKIAIGSCKFMQLAIFWLIHKLCARL